MGCQSQPVRPGVWVLIRDGAEVGMFSMVDHLLHPSVVLADVCAAIDADDERRAAA